MYSMLREYLVRRAEKGVITREQRESERAAEPTGRQAGLPPLVRHRYVTKTTAAVGNIIPL